MICKIKLKIFYCSYFKSNLMDSLKSVTSMVDAKLLKIIIKLNLIT